MVSILFASNIPLIVGVIPFTDTFANFENSFPTFVEVAGDPNINVPEIVAVSVGSS
jgi:hypothetical protein